MSLVVRADPRLERWLGRLGITYEAGATVTATLDGRPLAITSRFPFHQIRQLMAAIDRPPSQLLPADEEGQAWKRVLTELADAPLIDGEGDIDRSVPPLAGLESALDVHQALETSFVGHRLALMQVDLPSALRTWRRFSRLLMSHLTTEDEMVAPRYRSSEPPAGWPRGGAPDIIDGEHNKIIARLDALTRALEEIADADRPLRERSAACLALLDRQRLLVNLLEHHDLRERQMVYPHLESVLDDREKAAIVRALLDWSVSLAEP